jgi:hypothetical protein
MMDCQSARLLLAFARRPAECVDPGEQVALRQHLNQCPDCAALAHDESRTDAALGEALREVPLPAGLEQRILTRLAAERRFPIGRTAAAAALLLAVGLAGFAFFHVRPSLQMPQIVALVEQKSLKDPDKVEEWFQAQGIEMQAPRQFRYDKFRDCDVVRFQGRLVPMLLFHDPAREVLAQVYVLSARQFRLDDLAGAERQSHTISILPQPAENPEVVYLVVHTPPGEIPPSLLIEPQ